MIKSIGGRPLALLCVISMFAMASCADLASQSDTDRPQVVAAFYPLEFLVDRVAGDRVQLQTLTPAGVDPHDAEFTPSQVEAAIRADLLVYLGRGFQPSLEDILDQVNGRKLDALERMQLLEGSGHDDDGHDDDGHDDDGHDDDGARDPHVWLDPSRMAELALLVADHLNEIVSGTPADLPYTAAAEELVAELGTLDEEFRAGLANCERRTVVTAHEAFGYLADRYDLEQVGISGIDPESEPTAGRLSEVSSLVRQAGVTTIFFERLLPPDVAETIARETGITTAMLDPLESPPAQGDYLSAMRANLEALRRALNC